MANTLQTVHKLANHVDGGIQPNPPSLLQVEPCYFPALDDGEKSAKGRNSVGVQLPRAAQVFAFCEENKVSISCYFRAVWSLVLRVYVGSDSVSFGYTSRKDDASNRRDRQNDEKTDFESAMFACCTKIDQTDPISRFLRDLEDAYVAYVRPRTGISLFNTVIICQELLDLRRSSGDVESSPAYSCLNEVSTRTCMSIS